MIKKLNLDDLKKLSNNPRTIKKEDFERLIKSIEKFWVIEWRPFLISNRTGENVIIWWNQRFEACKKLWIKQVPCYIMEDLTEEEEKEIIIRDNISNGDWDFDILANDFEVWELEEWGVNLPNFDEIDFDEIDFDNIKSNEDREISDKTKDVCCPECDFKFKV